MNGIFFASSARNGNHFFSVNPDILVAVTDIYLIKTIGQEGIPTTLPPCTKLRGTSLLVRPRDTFV